MVMAVKPPGRVGFADPTTSLNQAEVQAAIDAVEALMTELRS